jgi:hypothetical protein
MSAGAVFQAALRTINKLHLPADAQRDVVTALEAGRPSLAMLYGLGYDAGLEHEPLMARSSGVYLGFCAGNLADDLVDGDCTYLTPPFRLGPGLQYLLQNASVMALVEAGIPAERLGAAARDLVSAAAEHQCEVRTTGWTAEIYRRIGLGIAGRQWAGYLKILWHATPLEPLAEPLGLGLGQVGHIAEDIRSGDPRFCTMPPEDQRTVVAWALDALPRMRAHGLASVEAMAHTVEPILRRAIPSA